MEVLAQRSKGKKVKLNRKMTDDLILWLEFLQSAKAGISINRIVFRKPIIATFSTIHPRVNIVRLTPSPTALSNKSSEPVFGFWL